MCGITGYIGRSKNEKLTYKLLTRLFENSESRGIDAAGFWATECGINGSVVYHKEPIRASKFVKGVFWNEFSGISSDLVIAHARGASKGVGEPFFNENNHPFTSTNKSIALAHNGRIEDNEYYEIRNSYEVKTACDSEILLRIFEASILENFDKEEKELNSIKEIFGLVNEGHMAAAIGKRGDSGERSLWLFRNEYRPLWISDLRDELGQIFFFSEPSIWEESCRECSSNLISRCYKLIEISPQEIWQIRLFDRDIKVSKYRAEKTDEIETRKIAKYYTVPQDEPHFNVITKLDENDQIIKEEFINLWSEIDPNEVEEVVNNIVKKTKAVDSELRSMVLKGLIDKEYFCKLLSRLKDQEREITKTLSILYE